MCQAPVPAPRLMKFTPSIRPIRDKPGQADTPSLAQTSISYEHGTYIQLLSSFIVYTTKYTPVTIIGQRLQTAACDDIVECFKLCNLTFVHGHFSYLSIKSIYFRYQNIRIRVITPMQTVVYSGSGVFIENPGVVYSLQ